jgi:hypothetical protein
VTTANWITILATVIAAAITYGALRANVGGVREQLSELRAEFNRSRESVGQRLEDHGKRMTVLETRGEYSPAPRRRRPTGTAE